MCGDALHCGEKQIAGTEPLIGIATAAAVHPSLQSRLSLQECQTRLQLFTITFAHAQASAIPELCFIVSAFVDG